MSKMANYGLKQLIKITKMLILGAKIQTLLDTLRPR